jgi:hypothetical protein
MLGYFQVFMHLTQPSLAVVSDNLRPIVFGNLRPLLVLGYLIGRLT